MVKFLNKFGSVGPQFLDTCNRCFYMFTYSQADWNLQALSISGNNNFFCKLNLILRKCHAKYIGFENFNLSNIQHDILTGYMDIKTRALYLFTSFFAKNWAYPNCILHTLIHNFLKSPLSFRIFRRILS